MLLEIKNFSAKTSTRTGNGLFIRHKKRQKTYKASSFWCALYIDQNPTFISSLLVRRTVEWNLKKRTVKSASF